MNIITCHACIHQNIKPAESPCCNCSVDTTHGKFEKREERSCDTCLLMPCAHDENELCTQECMNGDKWQNNQPEERSCGTCKHAGNSAFEVPCDNCYSLARWEHAECPVYIHEVEQTMFECPKCGKQYSTREKAVECYRHNLLLKQYQKCLPWRWYKVADKDDDGHERWVFVCRLSTYEEHRARTHGTCLDATFSMYSAEVCDRYTTREWKIDPIGLTLMEGYEKYSLVPNLLKKNLPAGSLNSIRDELEQLEETVRKDCRDRVLARPLTEIIETAIEDEFKKVWP